MKKIKLIIAAAAMLGLVSSSAVYADGFGPGEGLYVGAFGGVGMGIVQPKVTTTAGSANNDHDEGGTFEATEGGLGLSGMEGGGWIGYGYKMGSLYAGLEGEYAVGDVEFELTSATGVQINGASDTTDKNSSDDARITLVTAKKDWTGGAFGRIGYYVNPNTLLAFKGGVLVSKFDVNYGSFSETYYGGGPSVGVSLASAIVDIDPNLSVRIGAVYTNFLTAPVSGIGAHLNSRGGTSTQGVDSEITGEAMSARFGIQYSFFDVNSLF